MKTKTKAKHKFTSDDLYNAAVNEQGEYKSIVHNVKMLRHTINRTATRLAKANADWHDDPEADDHAAHHAPPDKQFPRELRDKAIRELVAYFLRELAITEET